jgi:hypothetical protein
MGRHKLSNLLPLITALEETRAYLARERNDYSWSSWKDQEQALAEIDSILAELENGSLPAMDVLFAPTGPIQEVSLSSGWGDEFIVLATYFDKAYSIAKSGS